MNVEEIVIFDDYASVYFNSGHISTIDICDIALIKSFNWKIVKSRNTNYVVRYEYRNKKRIEIRLHRVLCEASCGDIVDHKDRNGLNNRKENLRICTNKQNIWNQGIRSTNKSGYRGVYWCGKRKKWRAQIQVNGKLKAIGGFDSKEDAAIAYAKESKNLYGEYSHLISA